MGNLFSFIFLTFLSFSFIFFKTEKAVHGGGGAFGEFFVRLRKLVMAHHFSNAPLVTLVTNGAPVRGAP